MLKNDCGCYNWSIDFNQNFIRVIDMLSLKMVINDCDVTLLFRWGDDEPDWESMEVIALLPTPKPNKAKYWVTINDVLSEADWDKISAEIAQSHDELLRQKEENDY